MKNINNNFENLLKEDSSRVQKKILEKLKLEGGIPANWWDGRSSSTNTTAKDEPRDLSGNANFDVKTSGQPDLEESSMGDVHTMASDAKTFKVFLKNVFSEFKDLQKSKESVAWLKTIYDENVNESINENKKFVYVLLDKGEKQVTIVAKNWDEANVQVLKKYKNSDPMLISVDGTKLKGFSGIEPRAKKYQEDTLPGGVSDDKTLEDVANHHKVDIDELISQFKMGFKVEREHTNDQNIASEIVRDHLWEDPNYYTKLDKMENESVNEMATFSVDDLVPDLIPKSERGNKGLHRDLAKVINVVLKKYGIKSLQLKE